MLLVGGEESIRPTVAFFDGGFILDDSLDSTEVTDNRIMDILFVSGPSAQSSDSESEW